MTRGRDDDALSWSGDDDPTLDVGAARIDDAEPVTDTAPAALPDGYTAVGKGSDEVGRIDADGAVTMPGERAPMGNAALISLGVFGGVYLLYVIGWIIGGLRLQFYATVADIPIAGYFSALVLAIAAPLVWFATVIVLTRQAKTWQRVAWLVAGVVLLVPWPLLMIGTN